MNIKMFKMTQCYNLICNELRTFPQKLFPCWILLYELFISQGPRQQGRAQNLARFPPS